MPQFWKGEARNAFRVRYAASDDQSRESDLVFLDERPFAVLEWSAAGAAIVMVELQAEKLRAADPSGRVFEYLELLVDPR